MVEILDSTGDLLINFEGDVQLQFLQLSVGYESWSLYVQDKQIICTGGGGIVTVSGLDKIWPLAK